MEETFTTTLNLTNSFEMKEQDGMENIESDETNFYNSIRSDLDMLEASPKAATIQTILNHSQNYVG